MDEEESLDPKEDFEEIAREEEVPPPKDDLEKKELSMQKELGQKREELEELIHNLPEEAPEKSSPDFAVYQKVLREIDLLKGKIASTQDDLMNLLRDIEKMQDDEN